VAFNSNSAIGTQLKSTNVTLSGNVSGSATVEKTGPGSLTLSSTSSPFAGTWSISGGSLNIDSDANLGAAGANLVLSNATLNSTGALNTARNIALGSNGASLNLGADSTLSGVLSGAGGINNIGSSAVTLSAAHNYAGKTTVTTGTIRQGVDNAIPASSAVSIATGATLDLGGKAGSVLSLSGGGNVTGSGAGLTLGANGTTATQSTFTGTISGGGSFTKAGSGTQTLANPGGAATNLIAVDGPINVTGGTLNVTGLNFGVYDLPSNDINIAAGATFGMSGTGTGGALFLNSFHGAGSLALLGGAVSLTSPSDFTGGTTIVVPTNLALADFGALGPAGTPIHFQAAGSSDRTYAGGILFGADGTFSHPIIIDGYKYAQIAAGVNLPQHVTLDQPISGPGDTDFGGLSGSSITFAAVNTYTGTTQVEPGVTLVVGVDNALPHDGGIYLYGTLDLNGHNQTLNSLGGGANASINLNGGNLTLDSDIDDIYGFGGVITGNGSLTKTGGGLQILAAPATGASNYTGPTAIHQGALQLSGNVNSLPAGGPVQVDKGADLIFATSAAGSNLPAGSTVNFTGNISGDGEVQIASTSVDPITLSGTNTYTGGTRISDGYLRVMDNSNLGAPTTPITYYWSGSNPGPVLQFGAADVNLTRNIVVQHSPAFVDTNGFNATVQNIDGNLNASTGGPADFRKLGGAGTLTANHVRVNTLTVSVGTLKIAPNTGANSVSNVRGLAIAAGAFFDLNNNKMVVGGNKTGTWDATNNVYTGVTGMVASARGTSGNWDGTTGITSSAITPGEKLHSIGVAAAGDIVDVSSGTATWNGQTVGAGDTLVMYTYGGDANLDGKINIDDYGLIDSHVGQSGTAFGWHNGDFNYDGKINIDDYGIIDGNIGAQGAPLTTSAQLLAASDGVGALGGVSAVPEPTSLALLGLAGGALLRRKRRSAR
jgi:autotransporter-associated beta strand protein